MPKDPKRPPRSTDDVVVEKLLRQLPHADPSLQGDRDASKRPVTPRSGAPGLQARPGGPRAPVPPSWKRSWAWTGGAIVLAVALSQWPYNRACGFPLFGYVAVVLVLVMTAVRATIISWTDRRGVAHTLALLASLASLVYAAEVILPRAGYAAQQAGWRCVDESVPVLVPSEPMLADTILVTEPESDSLAVPGDSTRAIGNTPTP